MDTRVVFFAAGLILATGVPSANAADIYAPSAGGMKDTETEEILIPEARVFEETADWYVRGDLGVGNYRTDDGTGYAGGAFGVDELDFDPVFSGSVGFGRYLSQNVRLGLDLAYRADVGSNFSGTESVETLTNLGTIPLELTTTSIMLNAIYEFRPQKRFSPYLGAGVGWAFHRLDLGGSSYTTDLDGDWTDEWGTVNVTGEESNHFAANLMAGVSVNLRPGWHLDMGYQFSYLGNANMDFEYSHPNPNDPLNPVVDQPGTIEIGDIMTHEFRIGLRYDIY